MLAHNDGPKTREKEEQGPALNWEPRAQARQALCPRPPRPSLLHPWRPSHPPCSALAVGRPPQLHLVPGTSRLAARHVPLTCRGPNTDRQTGDGHHHQLQGTAQKLFVHSTVHNTYGVLVVVADLPLPHQLPNSEPTKTLCPFPYQVPSSLCLHPSPPPTYVPTLLQHRRLPGSAPHSNRYDLPSHSSRSPSLSFTRIAASPSPFFVLSFFTLRHCHFARDWFRPGSYFSFLLVTRTHNIVSRLRPPLF